MLSTGLVRLSEIRAPRGDRARRKTGPLILALTEQGWYDVLSGHAAYRAALKAGQDMVPCLVRTEVPDPADRLAEHRYLEGLGSDPLKEARAIKELMGRWEVPQCELARRIGVTQSHISKRLSLLDLPPADQAKLAEGALTIDQAYRKARGLPLRTARRPNRRRRVAQS